MKNKNRLFPLLLAALMAATAAAEDELVYAEEDGTIKRVPVASVTRDNEKEFSGRILVGGRRRRLTVPARRVIEFRRGSPDSINQWAKRLATAKRYMTSGKLANEGTDPGAEEILTRIAYSTEEGIKGEEAAYAIQPWHNMYAVFYLIETRYLMGKQGDGDEAKLKQALDTIEEFRKRSAGKEGRRIAWDVPGPDGVSKGKVYAWGSTRLEALTILWEARIQAALKDKAKALEAYDRLIEEVKKKDLSPRLLATAIIEKAEVEAEGQDSDKQETLFRSAGTVLASLARSQRDEYGKESLGAAANRALLRGADLLLESARKKGNWDVPLRRYEELQAGAGRKDPALYMGAATGIGICLTEKGEGEKAYQALLDVVTEGGDFPQYTATALYYLSRACKLFADQIDAAGGKGDFLRAESDRWLSDLKERYPSSEWAKKAG
jgi:hypothetical protein